MPSDAPTVDYRLRELVNSIDSPYQLFKIRVPSPRDAVYEPASLNFLYLLEGFHLGQMPSIRFIRSPLLYNVLVNRFTAITTDIIILLNNVLYFKLFTGDPLLSRHECVRIKALYGRYNIYKAYPLLNLLARLHTTMNVISQFPEPRMQLRTLCQLPDELLTSIALACTYRDMRNLAASCRNLREAVRPWLQLRGTFVLQYDHTVNHTTTRDSVQLVDRLFRAVQHSSSKCVALMWDFLSHADSLNSVRLLTFDNQWERLLPMHTTAGPPNPLNLALFKDLYNAIISVLQGSRPTHLRLISLGITRKLFHQIAHTDGLTHLTLHSCTPDKFVLNPASNTIESGMHLSNITYLALGFCRGVRDNRRCWQILQFCFNMRHFFAYPADTTTTITYPDRTIYTNIPHIHNLHRLHIDCGSSILTCLIGWLSQSALRYSASSRDVHGSLTHFKLSTKHGLHTGETNALLDVLSEFHPNLRVLVIEGVMDATSALRRICSNFHNLEGLTLFRALHDDIRDPILCQWGRPSYEYAVMLSDLPRLRHFQCNFEYSPFTYGPSAFSAAVYPVHPDSEYDCAENNPSYLLDFNAAYLDDEAVYREMRDRLKREDSLCDGPAIARPFAAYCPSLESFVIRADVTFFSCMISRLPNSGYQLYDVIDRPSIGGFQYWNPLCYSSWAYDATDI